MVSSGLIKMASTAQNTFNKIRTSNGTLTQSYEQIRRKISQLESTIANSTSIKHIRQARLELQQLNRLAIASPGNISRGVGGLFAGLFRQLLPALGVAGALSLGGGVLGAGVAQERNITSLRTFIGTDAERAYGNIVSDASRTPFGIESLLDVNRALITTGISADRARQDTLNLANAISATGGSNPELMRMAVNMQQIANAGKATALDIRQFAYAGINIYGILEKATGKTKAELKDMDVTYDLLAYALNKAAKEGGLYAGAMEAQMKTVGGRFNMMKDNIRIGAADIGTSLQPFMHSLIDLGNSIISFVIPATISLVTWLKENWNWLGPIISTLATALIAYRAVTLATQIWTGAQVLLNAAMTANPIGLIIAAVAALIAILVIAWNKFDKLRGLVKGSWELWKGFALLIKDYVVDVFKALVSLAGGLGGAIAKLFQGDWSGAWDAAKNAINEYNSSSDAAKQHAAQNASQTARNALGAYYNEVNKKKESETTSTTPSSANVTDFYKNFNTSGFTGDGDSTARGIAGGGPRIINIHINKLVEKLEVHAVNVDEGLKNMEDKIEEHLLRVLNSGAAVQ